MRKKVRKKSAKERERKITFLKIKDEKFRTQSSVTIKDI